MDNTRFMVCFWLARDNCKEKPSSGTGEAILFLVYAFSPWFTFFIFILNFFEHCSASCFRVFSFFSPYFLEGGERERKGEVCCGPDGSLRETIRFSRYDRTPRIGLLLIRKYAAKTFPLRTFPLTCVYKTGKLNFLIDCRHFE